MSKEYQLISDEEKNLANAWMEIGDVTELTIPQNMLGGEWGKSDKIAEMLVQTCLDPDSLHFFCKYILNIDILPFQAVILNQLWHKRFPMLLASRGLSKSFTLAIYIICRAVLHQGCSISVTGASLRQSLVLFVS